MEVFRSRVQGFPGPSEQPRREEHNGGVATWEDVRRLVAALPETDEHASYGGAPAWRVRGKNFVWERLMSAADRGAPGAEALDGDEPVLGAQVADEGVKDALVGDEPEVFFTIPHFDGHPVVLVRLGRARLDVLAEIVQDAWRTRAPRRLLVDDDARPDGAAPTVG